MRHLIKIGKLSEISGIPVGTLRTMVHRRKIPYIKPGHRTLLFDQEEVMKALHRFEVKAIA
jgi:excisionase family DNA binding protein